MPLFCLWKHPGEDLKITLYYLLRVRFGTLDNELQATVEPLLALPPKEFRGSGEWGVGSGE